jgi:hypothetical protein
VARQMEIYAGFREHTDHEVGRLLDALGDLEILDDTLIYYIIGDNGASADAGVNGVIISQGGAFGGCSLYLVDGRPRYCYNLFGLQQFHVAGDEPVPAGDHQVRVEFTYDGGGLAKGGTAALFLDGDKVAQGRVDATVPMLFSGDETCDIGEDTASPVADDYPADRSFTGRIHWVQLDIGDDDEDHLITPEQRLRVAMTRQ